MSFAILFYICYNIFMLNVYYLDIEKLKVPNDIDLSLLPENRRQYILSINDTKRKKQSFYVWKLLEQVLTLNGIKFIDNFNVNNNIWQLKSNEIQFSLAHSDSIVAVAISNTFIGVDVEKISDKILKVGKLFKDNKLDNNVENLTKLWTEKESFYKLNSTYNLSANKSLSNQKVFYNSKIICDNKNSKYYITTSTIENINCEFIEINYKG